MLKLDVPPNWQAEPSTGRAVRQRKATQHSVRSDATEQIPRRRLRVVGCASGIENRIARVKSIPERVRRSRRWHTKATDHPVDGKENRPCCASYCAPVGA